MRRDSFRRSELYVVIRDVLPIPNLRVGEIYATIDTANTNKDIEPFKIHSATIQTLRRWLRKRWIGRKGSTWSKFHIASNRFSQIYPGNENSVLKFLTSEYLKLYSDDSMSFEIENELKVLGIEKQLDLICENSKFNRDTGQYYLDLNVSDLNIDPPRSALFNDIFNGCLVRLKDTQGLKRINKKIKNQIEIKVTEYLANSEDQEVKNYISTDENLIRLLDNLVTDLDV